MADDHNHQSFDKPMRDVDWLHVLARQAMRAPLLQAWFDALNLGQGAKVADLGCGPGYVAMRLALRVGPRGKVYAVDRSSDALDVARGLMTSNRLDQVEPLAGDVATMRQLPGPVDAVLATMMLHHTDDLERVLANLARLAGPRTPLLLGEFHPGARCEIGPPREHRIAPAALEAACRHAGLETLEYRRQTAEHYYLVVASHMF